MNLKIDFWIHKKKYWNLVECKRKHLTRFNVYFNFVHSLLNIRRFKLASSLPGQWDPRQSCKYTLGAIFGIISQKFLIIRHKFLGRATIVRHNIKHVLGRAIATRVAFYSRPGLNMWLINYYLTLIFGSR